MDQSDTLDISKFHTLIPCEWRVLLCLSEDRSNSEIANRLCLSKKSVETYQTRIGIKLEITGRSKVAFFARRNRIMILKVYDQICLSKKNKKL
ncbi:response regulator transcription factor [Arundinibacter roseus]|uniref:Response regulator transcription factor n=1 Tax=Arundinibacter roseus TaxID=2070510 RepID=A0A4R4JW18_9BACT|nr:response regulator transcription factor [Arundinibacter roseus]